MTITKEELYEVFQEEMPKRIPKPSKIKCVVCEDKYTTKYGLFCKKCVKREDIFIKIEAYRKSKRSLLYAISFQEQKKYYSKAMSDRFQKDDKGEYINKGKSKFEGSKHEFQPSNKEDQQ